MIDSHLPHPHSPLLDYFEANFKHNIISSPEVGLKPLWAPCTISLLSRQLSTPGGGMGRCPY